MQFTNSLYYQHIPCEAGRALLPEDIGQQPTSGVATKEGEANQVELFRCESPEQLVGVRRVVRERKSAHDDQQYRMCADVKWTTPSTSL